MSTKRILSLVLALVMVLGTFGTVFAAEPTGNTKVDWLVEQGYVLGDAGGLRLEDGITRAEVSVIVAKALGLEAEAAAMANIPSRFSDMNAGYAWANGFVNVLNANGYISGYPNGTFGPAKDITYAEVASMLVRVMGGLTEAEAKTAVWPTTYLAKAASLGIFEGVAGVDYSTKAVRGKIFEMVYNTLDKEVGNNTVIKAIVLENNRVATLNKDEVVVEIIEEVQRAQYVTESRDKKGDQISLTMPANLKDGDVEDLLGKVANFTLDKNGKVIKITIDGTYKYVTGSLAAIEDALKVGSTEYTVVRDERLNNRDDRIFRTYLNNKSYKYSSFADAAKYTDADVTETDYARVTIKNGKVLFIDSFNFDDIAPIKEVKKDGAEVYVYNDARDGGIKRFDITASARILAIKEGKISKITREDIKENDVIHAFTGGYIVRKDAVVNGTFTKVSQDKYSDVYVHIDDNEYYVPEVANKQAVYSYDSKDFYTLNADAADRVLREFREEKVTALLDLSDSLQYIGSEIELGEFVALVTRISGNDLRVLKSDGTKAEYRATLDTKYVVNGSTGHQNLNNLNVGELVYLSVDGEKVEKVVRLTEGSEIVTALDSKDIKVGTDEYRILSGTHIFVSQGNTFEVRTAKSVADAFKDKKAGVDFKAYVVDGKEFVDNAKPRRDVYTNRDTEAYAIVFKEIAIAKDLKTQIVKFNGYADKQETQIEIIFEDGITKEVRKVDNSVSLAGIAIGDIIVIGETKDDNKTIMTASQLIEARTKDRTNVFGVKNYDKFGNLTLVDGNKDPQDFVVSSDTVIFGGNMNNAEKISYALVKNSAGVDTKYVRAIVVRANSATITGDFGITSPVTGDYKLDYTSGNYVNVTLKSTDVESNFMVVVNNVGKPIVGLKTELANPVVTGTLYTVALVKASEPTKVLAEKSFFAVSAADVTARENVAADKAALAITYTAGDSATSVTGNVTLPTSGAKGSTITWTSSDAAINITGGVVTQPAFADGDKTVTLTATITDGTVNTITDTKVFTVVVKAAAANDVDKVALDKAALTIAGDLNNVTANLVLAGTGTNGSTITWASNNTAVVANNGTVVRPNGANVTVELTATITINAASVTKVFYVTVIGQ